MARQITFKIFETSAPAGVERNGIRMPQFSTQSALTAAGFGWFYDSTGTIPLCEVRAHRWQRDDRFGPDSVGDGATDSWRNYWGYCTDGNARQHRQRRMVTNLQDYFAGTNPNDPTSTFHNSIVSPAIGGTDLSSTGRRLGITYQVQWKNLLTDSTWQPITPNFSGTGSTMSWLDDGTQTGGFPAARASIASIVP